MHIFNTGTTKGKGKSGEKAKIVEGGNVRRQTRIDDKRKRGAAGEKDTGRQGRTPDAIGRAAENHSCHWRDGKLHCSFIQVACET